MADNIDRKPIEAGIIQRVRDGVRYAITGVKPETWMSPNQPIPPIAQEVKGRQYDFQVGQNLNYLQRTQGTGIRTATFPQLRALADNFDLMRLAIETRKDQAEKLEWCIKAKDKKNTTLDNKIQFLTDFFSFPDRRHSWNSWLRQLLEDVLVIDAPAIYPRLTNKNDLYALELIDGATITPLIDDSGRAPLPPSPAYQQILKGVPAVDYSSDELIYCPRNLRTNSVYGYSPVEQIVMTVNIGIRRQLYQLQYYTAGNVPEALIGVPKEWNTNQIKEFQEYFDSLLVGNTAQRRRAKFVPEGMNYIPTKEPPLKDEYDEWLARLVCYAFSLSPQSLMKQMNRASAETQQETATDEGLEPLKIYIKNLIDFILVKYFGETEVEFAWQEEVETDALKQAQINDIYVRNGVKSVDEVRAELGLDPINMSNAVYGAMGVEFVKDLIDPNYQDAKAQQNEQNRLQAPEDVNDSGSASARNDDEKAQKLLKREKKKPVLKRINRDRAAVNKNTRKLKASLTKFLKAQGKNIAQQILQRLKKDDTADEVQRILDEIDFQGWTVIIGDVEETLKKMGKDGADMAYLQIGGVADDESIVSTSDAGTVDYAKRRAAELVGMRYNEDGDLVENPDARWAITDSTRDMLRSTLVDAIEEGWSNDKLADEIKNNFAFSSSRAEMIARTEIKRADTQGSLEAYKSSGLVQGKESLLSFDYDDDDECQDNADAGVIPLDEPFPSGDDAPPYHPNCRCDLIPALIETGEEGGGNSAAEDEEPEE